MLSRFYPNPFESLLNWLIQLLFVKKTYIVRGVAISFLTTLFSIQLAPGVMTQATVEAT